MQYHFEYHKKTVIQALRFHFLKRNEIRIMIVLVNAFAILSAVLYYMGKIRPEPFLLGSIIWLVLMISFWYILPNNIYKKSATFQDQFVITTYEEEMVLENQKGQVSWPWTRFVHFFESPHFFHLYFDAKSFFLVPKENMTIEDQHLWRGELNEKIGKAI